MTTVTKTFSFDSSAEGFADQGADLTGAYDGADGSPSSGCYAFTGDPDSGGSGSAYYTPLTWEGLGVWPGGTVTAVECTAYKVNSDNSGYLTIDIFITDLALGAIMPSQLVASAGTITGPTGWVTGDGLNGSQTLTASQSSRTGILCGISVYSENSGASVFKLDTITLSITFTGGINPVRVSADRLSNRTYSRIWRRGETR